MILRAVRSSWDAEGLVSGQFADANRRGTGHIRKPSTQETFGRNRIALAIELALPVLALHEFEWTLNGLQRAKSQYLS